MYTHTNTHKHTHTQTHKHTNKQTNKHTNKQTNTQTHKQTNKRTNERTNKQTDRQTNKQTHKHRHKHRHTHTGRTTIFQSSWWDKGKCAETHTSSRPIGGELNGAFKTWDILGSENMLASRASSNLKWPLEFFSILKWSFHTFTIFSRCLGLSPSLIPNGYPKKKGITFEPASRISGSPAVLEATCHTPFLSCDMWLTVTPNATWKLWNSWKIRIISSLDHLQKAGGFQRVLETDEC